MEKSESSLKNVQNELYELMKIVHNFCEQNEIDYSLIGGSLLGAIRHNGFIPWDDDLDIIVTRENFEKFCECIVKNPPENCVFERDQWVYRIRRTHKTQGYVPSVDIFILDKAPKSKLKNSLQTILLKVIQGLLRNNEKENNYSRLYRFLIRITDFLGRFANKEKLFKRYDRISQWGRKEDSEKLAIYDDRFKLIKLRYDKSLADSYSLHQFNDSEFEILDNYDHYLTLQFGNYMELPPEADRVPEHIF